ncbi:calcium/sodium antiporter [Sphingobacterium sp. DN00404]|uniref:Calcium/sodium antiporter n=1 Tax=Sphingobacterium micropteri TaxID=2763501 RepID=A0ABR7YLM3_9SPHI|nr:calcium/sodium antiporter [Sphingobacterium micropteri]MBD1432213.1 calcium/sodium antiporter [Sphingobacterium micropteri]
MTFSAVITFLFGLIIITVGAEILLKGASKIATLLNIRPIVIGLTVVSIGTSLPELAVGLTAIGEGAGDIAIGNIAGTNLVNILFILGLSAAIRPLPLNLRSIKTEMFTMIIAAVLLLVLSLDGELSTWDGLIMLFLGSVYLIIIVRTSRQEPFYVQKEFQEEYETPPLYEKKDKKVWVWNFMLLFCGIVATIYGAEKLVDGAVEMAKHFGMSDAVIGLTIIAIGTSAPELATTIVATFNGERDVAVGNLLGSSVINIFIILGITSIFTPGSIGVSPDILWFDLPLAALVAIVCYPVFKSDQMVSRKEGVTFVSLYLAYLVFLLMYRV